jgi:hypothetical protein
MNIPEEKSSSVRSHQPSMERNEFVACLYRDPSGHVRETEWPKGEPDRKTLQMDLYCPTTT